MLAKILLSDGLKNEKNKFINENNAIFDHSEENKLEQTPIHNKQIELMDLLIEKEAERLGLKLDMDLIKSEFEKDP